MKNRYFIIILVAISGVFVLTTQASAADFTKDTSGSQNSNGNPNIFIGGSISSSPEADEFYRARAAVTTGNTLGDNARTSGVLCIENYCTAFNFIGNGWWGNMVIDGKGQVSISYTASSVAPNGFTSFSLWGDGTCQYNAGKCEQESPQPDIHLECRSNTCTEVPGSGDDYLGCSSAGPDCGRCNNNGRIDNGEQCDGNDFGGASCESLGKGGGTLNCRSDCTFNTDRCTESGGGGGGPRIEECGDGRVGTGEECDLGGGNGACPSACSNTCQLNVCGVCELPTSPYFSVNSSDLSKYGRRLENGSCYFGSNPVSGQCVNGTPTTTDLGHWRGRESDNSCEKSDRKKGRCYNVCNQDNNCPGCYFGEYNDYSRQTCTRRYSCNIDNGLPVEVDMKCGSNSNGPCEVTMGGSTNLSWTVTTRYGLTTTCTASGDWSGARSASGGSQGTGNLNSARVYNYILLCTNAGGSAQDTVNVIVNPPPPPVVDMRCGNNSNGPCVINFGSSIGLTWTVSGVVDTCTASGDTSGGWSGSKSTGGGSQNTGNLNTPKIYNYTLSCTGPGGVGWDTVNVIVNSPIPSVSNVSATQNYCISGPAATINWTYSDPSGSSQQSYQVQVTNTGNFDNPLLDSGKVNSFSTAYFTGQGVLQFNTTYKARVRAWNGYDVVSDWTESNSFKTPNFAYPQINFTWTANGISENLNPSKGSPIQFTDQTVFGGNQSQREWSWDFGDSTFSTIQNPSKIYNAEGVFYVTLTVEDSIGQSCIRTKGPLTIQKAIPKWREVAPR